MRRRLNQAMKGKVGMRTAGEDKRKTRSQEVRNKSRDQERRTK